MTQFFKTIRAYSLAFIVSIFVFIYVLSIEPGFQVTALFFVMFLVWFISVLKRRSTNESKEANVEKVQLQEDRELFDISVQISSALSNEYGIVKKDLSQGKALINDAINELQKSFNVLTEKSSHQSTLMATVLEVLVRIILKMKKI